MDGEPPAPSPRVGSARRDEDRLSAVMQTSLPEIDARLVSDDSRPWLSLRPYAELASIKLLAADPVRGEVIFVLRTPPGIELPRHRTSGPTIIYTVQGRWRFREHDWVAGPGSLVIEPAASCLTACVPGDGTDDAVTLVLATGDVQFLDDAGRVLGVENWRSITDRYLAHCESLGLEPQDVLPTLAPVAAGGADALRRTDPPTRPAALAGCKPCSN